LILSQTGRGGEVLALLDRSLELAPRNAGFLNNRARVLSSLGRSEEALRDLRRAVQWEPRFYAGLCHLGSVLRTLGRLEEAGAAFRRALAIEPRQPEAHVGLGNVQKERGDHAAALQSYDAALAADPENVSALYNLANLFLARGEFERAEASLRRVLEREPRHAMAFNNLGVVLRRTGHAEAARACFERAVALEPHNADALNNLGLALQQNERFDEATARYAQALAARPAFPQALLNWGNALKDRGDLEGARALYERALALEPDYAEALTNSAGIALTSGDLEGARALYERVARARPQLADALFGLSQIELREQHFAAGWDASEWRFKTDPPLAIARHFAIARLTANELARVERLALWKEQGVGDQILFSTLLPELERRRVAAVVEVDARLAAIYRRSLPAFTFTTPEESERAFAACDHELPMGSLPGLFRRSIAAFQAQPRALLLPDEERVAAIRARLGAGRWIAISWRSVQTGDRRALAARKSIPLENFAHLAAGARARLLDLQYGEATAEREQFESRHPGVLVRIEGLDTFHDLEGTIAAIAACERVVTASNVTAHLAGAIGKPTSVVYLRALPPFHYWVPGPEGRSLWYPAVDVVSDASWSTWEQAFEALAGRLGASER
ncbi:MAG TPA: tetratricopeptide repeat protein, partial [Usitatibacter sp.]|nr:tetratricopeptide repeat protein [Usitatibacter sp.]